MRARQAFTAVDSHTEGMPARVITSPVVLPGQTMADRRRYLMSERDDLRTLLMCEPRGMRRCRGRSCNLRRRRLSGSPVACQGI